MSEKLNNSKRNEDVKTEWDRLTESDTREHGITVGSRFDNGRDISWSEKDWEKTQSATRNDNGNDISWSEKDWLETEAAMASDEQIQLERQRRTGASSEAVQEMSENAFRGQWSTKKQVNAILDVLEQEPDSVRSVIERRARSTLGDFKDSTFNPDKVYSDLTFINAAVDRGNINVSEMRIAPEPLLTATPKQMGVGKMLDLMLEGIDSKADLQIKDPNNPKKTIDAKQFISEIRSKIKDPTETPSEKAAREAAELRKSQKAQEKRALEKAHEEMVATAREAAKARAKETQRKRELAQQISETRQELAIAKEEYDTLSGQQKNNFLKRLTGRGKGGNSEFLATKQKVDELTEKLSILEKQGKDIGIL